MGRVLVHVPVPRRVRGGLTPEARELRLLRAEGQKLSDLLTDVRRDILTLEALTEKTTRDGKLHGRRRKTLNRQFDRVKQRLTLPPKQWS